MEALMDRIHREVAEWLRGKELLFDVETVVLLTPKSPLEQARYDGDQARRKAILDDPCLGDQVEIDYYLRDRKILKTFIYEGNMADLLQDVSHFCA